MGTTPLVVGLDVGGTKTLAVVVDARDPRTVLTRVRRLTRAGGASGVLATVTDVLAQVSSAAGTSPDALAAIGVGVPGVVDPTDGTVRHAVNLGVGRDPVDLLGPLRRFVGHRAVLANDVNLAALGAAEILVAKGDIAYLSIGTGVAAGFVIGGEIHQGTYGAAGEIGHLPVDPGGPPCECGQRGCLETVASGAAIARLVREADGRAVDAAGLFAAADAGSRVAAAVRDEMCGRLAAAVALITQTVDPELVVLGGGVAEVGEPLVDGVRAALRRRAAMSPLLSALALADRVTTLPEGSAPGALGAAVAAQRLLDGRPEGSIG